MDNAVRIEMLRRMLRIRLFEEEASARQADGEIPGPLHTSVGEEATAVGAGLALQESDYITGTHRSHGHPIGKGAALRPLMAELYGKQDGVCRGFGGSMHLADFSIGSLGESGIVGSGIPVAVGAGLSAQLRGSGQVALSFFGDGAVNGGPFHESLNLAAVWALPVIFFCENNGYACMTPASETRSIEEISQRAASYGIPGVVVDGQDVLAVHRAVSEAVVRARAGGGPTLLDVKTYRFREHAEFGRISKAIAEYRTADEVASWTARDPIVLLAATLEAEGVLDRADADAVRESVAAEVADAVEFARSSPYPSVGELFTHLYAVPLPDPLPAHR